MLFVRLSTIVSIPRSLGFAGKCSAPIIRSTFRFPPASKLTGIQRRFLRQNSLEQLMGEATVSRLIGMTRGNYFKLKGEDFRRREKMP